MQNKPRFEGMDADALRRTISLIERVLPTLTDQYALVTALESLSVAREQLEGLTKCSRGSSSPSAR